jgi:hypothetical protein
MPFSSIPGYFLVSTLGSPLFVPIWIVCLALILLFQGTAAMLATLVVRRFVADARSFSGWHVSRWAMSGLLAGFALLLAADRWTGYPASELVLGLALLALPAGVVLGTLRGARYQSAL